MYGQIDRRLYRGPAMKPAVVRPGAGVQDRTDTFAGRNRGSSKPDTARRAFTILDLVSRREGLAAKALARELGVSLSTCYRLINIPIRGGLPREDRAAQGKIPWVPEIRRRDA